MVAFAESLSRVAANGGGPAGLATHLAAALDAAVLVEDNDWRHVTLAGAGSRALPASARDLFEVSDDGALAALRWPHCAGAVVARLRAGETGLGWLAVFPGATSVEHKHGAIRLAAAAIAVELARDAGGTKSRQRTFWDRLLANAYDDAQEAKDDAASRGIALAPAYIAVVLEPEGLDETTAAAKSADLRRVALETLRAGSGEIVALERGDGFTFLCPATLEIDAQNARTAAGLIPRALSKTHRGFTAVGGIGRRADAIVAGRSVDEAREAAVIARRMFGGGRVMAFDDLGVYPMLLRGGASNEDLHRFSDRVLAPLRAYDEKHQTELLKTLRLYFELGQNVKTAATQLNVHRHTVFYRLRQIAEISGLGLNSSHDQLTLRTALAIDALTH